jgi:hypothetical protein
MIEMSSQPLKISEQFDPISLKEMDCVSLMSRIDTKYVINLALLEQVLSEIHPYYFVLEIDKNRCFPYVSLYYDTIEDFMYLAHHNGRLDRYKIRFRKYIDSDLTYLEVKHKIKGTRTVKERIRVEDFETSLSKKSLDFINKNTPFEGHILKPVIYTDFNRITLVNKNLSERVTIDTYLTFHSNGNDHQTFANSVIVELKRDISSGKTLLIDTLQKYGAYPEGLSKYCLARVLVDENIKKNNFKEKLIQLNKIENGKFYYRNLSTT